MKAVIPVAGAGTKLRPHTHTQPKPLIPVAGKPILAHIIDNLIDAGITDLVFVVGYLKEKIQDFVENRYKDQINMQFVVQEPRKGIAHALWIASKTFQQESEILVVLGDTIFESDTIRNISKQFGAYLAVQKVDSPREFGIAVLGEQNKIRLLKEKPEIPTSNLALVGLYKINSIPILLSILESMDKRAVLPHEELSLTEALMLMIEQGVEFGVLPVENWFDCGRKQTLLETNRILLERLDNHQTYNFHNSVILPPVHISPNCHIENSIVGPYATVAEHTNISNSIVKDSILGAYSELDSIIISKSVIGNDSTLRGKTNSINIGDNTEIDYEQ